MEYINQSLVQRKVDEILEPSNDLGELVEMVAEPNDAIRHLPSYHPTRWAALNRALDVVDDLTNGRADWVVRFVSYIFFGGTAAIVNLAVFAIMLLLIPTSFNAFARTLIAGAAACEISLVANFLPNDYFTFRHMSGRQRSWFARCARFHATSLVGSVLTIILQQFFSHVVHIMPLLGQALAIILVLFYNFSFHHLFTYRHINK
jgi:putative flippase GtrA